MNKLLIISRKFFSFPIFLLSSTKLKSETNQIANKKKCNNEIIVDCTVLDRNKIQSYEQIGTTKLGEKGN